MLKNRDVLECSKEMVSVEQFKFPLRLASKVVKYFRVIEHETHIENSNEIYGPEKRRRYTVIFFPPSLLMSIFMPYLLYSGCSSNILQQVPFG